MEDYTSVSGDHVSCRDHVSEECRALAIKVMVLTPFVFPFVVGALFIVHIVILGISLAGLWLMSRLLCTARWLKTTCVARLMKTTTTYQCEPEELHRWIEDIPELLEEDRMKRMAGRKEKKKGEYVQLV